MIPLIQPEDELGTLYIRRPNGERVRYVPPIRIDRDAVEVELAPGESIYESMPLSFGAKGPQFREPGEYSIRAYYYLANAGVIVSPSCRLRIASPYSRNSEELAHLLFDYKAAKFLYFGGSERYPEVNSNLKEAVEKYAKTDPVAVRHIHAALGLHQSRPFKQVITREGKRVLSLRNADLEEAIVHLQAARSLLPIRKISALDNILYNKLSILTAESYQKQGKVINAERILRESLEYFMKQGVVKSVINDYKKRIKTLSKRKR